jgi:hypothetical protein
LETELRGGESLEDFKIDLVKVFRELVLLEKVGE